MPRRTSPHPAIHRTVRALHYAIQEQGLNKRDTCQRAGLNREQLYRWTTGKHSPRVDDLEAMLNIVGLRLTVEPLNSENPDATHPQPSNHSRRSCRDPRSSQKDTPMTEHLTVEEIERLLEAATPGDWIVENGSHYAVVRNFNGDLVAECEGRLKYDDAKLIAAATTIARMYLATARRSPEGDEVEGQAQTAKGALLELHRKVLGHQMARHEDRILWSEFATLLEREALLDGATVIDRLMNALARQQGEIASLREQLEKVTTTQTPEK